MASFGPLKPLGPQLAEAPLFASKHINLSDRNVVGTGPETLILLMASSARLLRQEYFFDVRSHGECGACDSDSNELELSKSMVNRTRALKEHG
jgi:hypothetical protein